jgi:hypothetical protein
MLMMQMLRPSAPAAASSASATPSAVVVAQTSSAALLDAELARPWPAASVGVNSARSAAASLLFASLHGAAQTALLAAGTPLVPSADAWLRRVTERLAVSAEHRICEATTSAQRSPAADAQYNLAASRESAELRIMRAFDGALLSASEARGGSGGATQGQAAAAAAVGADASSAAGPTGVGAAADLKQQRCEAAARRLLLQLHACALKARSAAGSQQPAAASPGPLTDKQRECISAVLPLVATLVSAVL